MFSLLYDEREENVNSLEQWDFILFPFISQADSKVGQKLNSNDGGNIFLGDDLRLDILLVIICA